MTGLLERIVARTRVDVAARREREPLPQLERRLAHLGAPRDFVGALRRPPGGPIRVIGEVKRASPSAGTLREPVDAGALAAEYAAHGAAAVSVLTDEPFFHGSLADLEAARRSVTVPLLRKDFVLDGYQVVEARAFGADAVLLIAAVLADDELRSLAQLADDLGLAALVEVHDARELDRALSIAPRVLGVNHRDLCTFEMRMGLFAELAPHIPKDVVTVAESGIKTPEDVARILEAGGDAVLVGETLVKAPRPGLKIRELLA